MPKMAFLLGSGGSLPAGMPSTDQITKEIVGESGFAKHSSGEYFRVPTSNEGLISGGSHVSYVRHFLREVERLIAPYYQEQPINYEQLYFAADQVLDSLTRSFENPLVMPFIERLEPRVWQSLQQVDVFGTTWNISDLAREAECFIHDVVSDMLRRKPRSLSHLEFLLQLSKQLGPDRIAVFTLNHDTLLEQMCRQSSLPFTTGFDHEEGHIMTWDCDALSDPGPRLRIIKIHGSVDWFRFARTDEDGIEHVILAASEARYPIDSGGQTMIRDIVRPLILVGTHNKIYDYTFGLYAELFHTYHRLLREVERVFAIGYGFGDIGVNMRLDSWIESSQNHHLTIVDPNVSELLPRIKCAIGRHREELLKSGQLRVISKGIEEIDLSEVCR